MPGQEDFAPPPTRESTPRPRRSSSCSTTTPRSPRDGPTPRFGGSPTSGSPRWPRWSFRTTRVRRSMGLPPLIDTAGDEYDRGGFARKRGRGEEYGDRFAHAGSVFGASACAAFYRREAVIRAGGFPEHFKAYFEDVDLSFRFRRLGHEIVHEPAAVVWHRVSSSYGRRPSRRVIEQQSCNEERVFWRNTRGLDRLRCLPRHAAVLAGKALERFQEGRSAVAARPGPGSGRSNPPRIPVNCPIRLVQPCPSTVLRPRIGESGAAPTHECV